MKYDAAVYGNLILGTIATYAWAKVIFFVLAVLYLGLGIFSEFSRDK